MTMNLCSLTQKPLKEPVVSLKSGHIFEKAEIEKHLTNFPYCPITNQSMEISDLIDIKTTATSDQKISSTNMTNKPAQSLRNVLSNLEDDYDTLVLQVHTLKSALSTTKQQLLHSVYLNQAANKVIAKLFNEKKKTDEQLQKLAYDQ